MSSPPYPVPTLTASALAPTSESLPTNENITMAPPPSESGLTPELTNEDEEKAAKEKAEREVKEKEDEEEKVRVEVIKERLRGSLGLTVIEVKVIGRGNNSIMRHVTFSPIPTRTTRSKTPPPSSSQPLTSPIPSGITTCIIREANPEGELIPSTAVPNEVIALHFARESGLPVSRVWDWQVRGEGEGSTGWMVLEVLEGMDLDTYVKGLDVDSEEGKEELRLVFEEEARMVKRVQEIKLPADIGFGGFRFRSDPAEPSPSSYTIESGPMPLPYGGPHPTLSALYAEMIQRQLAAADGCPWLDGWKSGGLRDRLDKFVEEGLEKVLKGVAADKPVFVHGDLNMANMLWDPKTKKITGVIDFEWSHAAGPADEWFYSFGLERGNYGGPYDDTEQEEYLNRCILTGDFPSPLPPTGPRPTGPHDPTAPTFIDWPRSLAWDTALATSSARRPCTTPGFEDAARVYWMAQEIAQWWILQERMVKGLGVVRMAVKREGCERNLGRYLEHWGY